MSPGASLQVPVVGHTAGEMSSHIDHVTTEEPLEIRVVVEEKGTRVRHSVAVTMRTPGKDLELAVGFLVSEGVVRQRQDVWRVEHCEEEESGRAGNIVEVHLAPGVDFDLASLSRNVITTSACGICGRTSIESVMEICPRRPMGETRVRFSVLTVLPQALESAQPVFTQTGGIHAAALFDLDGVLLRLQEDVGRHNALDKLVGELLLAAELPASERLLAVSGRASFELVQKALLAGIPILAAVGAPSSLAIELADEFGMTLVGFLREDRFNVYAGNDRIVAK